MYVCVYVCVSERERYRERRVCNVCVCVSIWVCVRVRDTERGECVMYLQTYLSMSGNISTQIPQHNSTVRASSRYELLLCYITQQHTPHTPHTPQ